MKKQMNNQQIFKKNLLEKKRKFNNLKKNTIQQ